MFPVSRVGNLIEPLSGRRWDRRYIEREFYHRVAFFQRAGLVAGDRVFTHHGNTLEFFVDLLAIWSLGGCAIPIDPRLTKFEVENLARAAAPRMSVWRGEVEASIAEVLIATGSTVVETPPPARNRTSVASLTVSSMVPSLDDPALILFTSGTTGEPKGVVHTHRSLRARWMSLLQCLGTEKFRRTLCLLPTHFGHGLICNCLFPWLYGQTLFIVPPFKPDLLMQLGSLLDEHEITFMSSVPSMWRFVLKTARPPRRGRIERVICGSAPLSARLWMNIREWAGTQDVVNAYGITETGSWVAGTTVEGVELEDGLIGLPWGAEVKILKAASTEVPPSSAIECAPREVGHVWLRTPALMQGYWRRGDLTKKVVTDGWFLTGDIGLVDERGILYLRGRTLEEINKGGTKIYPGDIDAVAERYEQTIDVCAFGYEDPLYGENIGIAVVLKSANDEGVQGLYDELREHLAKFQMPQRWYLVQEIPRTSRGKINRSEVAQRCARLQPIDHRVLARAEG